MKLSAHKKKLTNTFLIILVVVVIYLIYKEEIFLYSCNNEQVGPSCMLLGSLYEERKEFGEAFTYYKKSCDLSYALGCEKLSIQEDREGLHKEATKHRKKACRLGIKTACQKN